MDITKSLSLSLPDAPTEEGISGIAGTARHTSSSQDKNDYAALKQLMKQRGLLEKQPVYYSLRIALIAGMLIAGAAFLLLVHIFWLQMLDAVFMAIVFTQIGLLSHEAGHRQMFRSAWKHDAVSMIGGNLLIGMSYGWWLDKHNTHHSHPNQVDMDPDLDIPFLEFTGMEDLEHLNPLRRFLVKYQAFVLLPALMIVAIGLQVNSVKFLLRKRAKYQALEWGLLAAHFVLYLAFVFSCMAFWQALLFIVVHQALTGIYLGSIFAPNHKGMTVLTKESKMDFLSRQVVTSRNVYGHPVTDFWYGGLNYQIEHHLFPSMPRNKLKEAQQLVKAFCATHDISYHETTTIQSFREILHYLHGIGAPLRQS